MRAHHRRTAPLLPEDFAETGLFVQRSGGVPKRFQVLGERSSGTNFLHRLLVRNTGLQPSEALGWKHGHPSAIAIPADLAVICLVRHAADWALSMHMKPWHATPALQELDFAAFLRAPWTSTVDRARYFDERTALEGQPLQADRDPVTGRVADSLPALRRAKLAGLLSYLNRGCTCALLRMEVLQAAPEATLDRLSAGLGLPPRKGAFQGVTKRLGAKFKPAVPVRPMTPAALTAEDMAFLRDGLDLGVEAQLGYRYAP